jgi:hypothetical protein
VAVVSAAYRSKVKTLKVKTINNNNKQTKDTRPLGWRPSKGPEKSQQPRESHLIRHTELSPFHFETQGQHTITYLYVHAPLWERARILRGDG